MAKAGYLRGKVDWYLREWMDSLGVRQVDMQARTGWSKTTASLLYNGIQNYNPRLINEAADALNLRPFELLLHPNDAMAIRRLRESAVRIAADSHSTFTPAPAIQRSATGG